MTLRLASMALLISMCVSSNAGAQDTSGPFLLPAGGFGTVGFGSRQSILSNEMQEARRNGLFEDTLDIRSGWINDIAQITGRLDIMTSARNANNDPISLSCTATAITADLILTNAHCATAHGKMRPISMRFLQNYRDSRRRNAVEVHYVNLGPVEIGDETELDYAILRLQTPIVGYQSPDFRMRDPGPGEPLVVIGHPEGQPLHLSRGRCRSDSDVPTDGHDVMHGCATRKGSSGSLVFSSEGQIVGLHFRGGAMLGGREINRALRMASLVERSPLLRDIFRKPIAVTRPDENCAALTLPTGLACRQSADGGLEIYAEQDETGPTDKFIQIWAQTTLKAANLKALENQSLGQIWIGETAGWFLVAIGPFSRTEANTKLRDLRSQRLIPADSFLVDGTLHGYQKVRFDFDFPTDVTAQLSMETACLDGQLNLCLAAGFARKFDGGSPEDLAKSTALYQTACNGGLAIGCAQLADNYRFGSGVAKNVGVSMSLDKRACLGGFIRACKSQYRGEW